MINIRRSKSETAVDYVKFFVVGIASIWLLIVSGLWARRTHELLGKSKEPLDALTLPPFIEGSIETYALIKLTLTYILLLLLPAVPTVVSLYMCYKTFSKFSHPFFKGVTLVLSLGLFIASVILQVHWTWHGLHSGTFVLPREVLNESLQQATSVLVSFWLLIISVFPAVIIVSLICFVYFKFFGKKKEKTRLE